MRFSIIKTILRKELLEIVRDQRMLYMLILLPVFLYPVLFVVMGRIGADRDARIAETSITLLLEDQLAETEVKAALDALPNTTLAVQSFTEEEVRESENTIAVRALPGGLAEGVAVLSNQSKDLVFARAQGVAAQLQVLAQSHVQEKLVQNQLPADFAQPFAVQSVDVAPPAAVDRNLISMIPMILLLFVFTGCIYIAIDITAGEKERRTLQTLFTAPLGTMEIVVGKFFAVLAVGAVSALMNTLAFLGALRLQVYLLKGEETSSVMSLSFEPTTLLWFIVLVLLATIFIAALCLAIMLLA
ncbi:MAG: ABC transporter permease subunit, partial [Bacteroidota bacterium]